MSQKDVGALVCKTPAAVGKWEREEAAPDRHDLAILADYFNTTVDYLFGRTDQMAPPSNLHRVLPEELRGIPVLGTLPADTPMYVREEEQGYLCLPRELLPSGELYVLHVRGDGMCGGDAPICAGDLAIIHRGIEVADKDICAVRVQGGEAVLKRVHFHDGYIDLLPENSQCVPQIHRADDVEIIGKLIWILQSH